MLQVAGNRETALEGRNVLVVEDDIAQRVCALQHPGAHRHPRGDCARNGLEALQALERARQRRPARH